MRMMGESWDESTIMTAFSGETLYEFRLHRCHGRCANIVVLDKSRMASPDTDGKATRPKTLGLLATKLTRLTLSSVPTGSPDGPRNKKWTIASLVCGIGKIEVRIRSGAHGRGCGMWMTTTTGLRDP